MLRLSGVTASRLAGDNGTRLPVLSGVSFDVAPNEFVCLVGPSGCGKTTLLRLVAGLSQADAGSISVDGQPVSGPDRRRGMLFQDYALFPWLTVRKNIEFGPSLRQIPQDQRSVAVDRLLGKVGLGDFAERYPHQLSGGMRQRVAIARALANDPELILMDEPFASLDAQTRKDMQHELLRLFTEHRKTVLFVTHSVEEAVYLGDRVIVMSRRPATVIGEVPIALPRPRLLLSEQFLERRRTVLTLLGSRV
ncbi:MAG: ABC transporter ATP-binding protein [Bacillota bacterium]